ncbi:MAG: hypothetical protein U1F26_18120 [Lysobacterales bacterium]
MALKVQDLVAAARAAVREIDAEQLLALQAGGAPVVDVREPAEYATWPAWPAPSTFRGSAATDINCVPPASAAAVTSAAR